MFDGVIERLQAFMNEQGGTSTVAEKIGKHPNKFYVMFRGETKPTLTTLMELVSAYPNLDLNWLVTGIESKNSNYQYAVISESEKDRRLKQFEIENEILKLQINELKTEKNTLYDLLRKSN